MNESSLKRCDFCGLEFDPACQETSCSGCPVSSNCSRIVCPRCGYQMPAESRLIAWLRSIQTRASISSEYQ